jgi:hypothetical protein
MQTEQLTRLLRQGTDSEPLRSEECPDDTEIAGFIDNALEQGEMRRIRRHVAGCAFCLERVGFVARLQEAEPPEVSTDLLARVSDLPEIRPTTKPTRRWRWPAASAAAAVVLLVLSVGRIGPFDGGRDQTSGDVRTLPELTLRPEVLSPREGAVVPARRLDQLEIRWTAVPKAVYYEIRLVTADGVRVWDARVETTSRTIPAGLRVDAGQELFVWVRAYLPDGRSLQSGIVGFQLESNEPARE